MIDYKTITRKKKKKEEKKKKSAANIVTSRSTLQVITNTMFIYHVHYTETIQSVTKPQQHKKNKQTNK